MGRVGIRAREQGERDGDGGDMGRESWGRRDVGDENIRVVRDGDIATKKKVNKHVTQQVKIGEERNMNISALL